MDWTAAAVGATPGLLALAWNMLSWKRSGPVIEVTAVNELPVFGDSVGEDWFIGVVASNKGRSPITVEGFGFRTPEGGNIVTMRPPAWSDLLPHRLEPGASATFRSPANEIRQVAAERGLALQKLRPFVHLAGDRYVFAKRMPIE